ncbi:nickel/cobalt efflux transporter [Piscinibacter terrae]|uniref:Nickel/cobalt efflux system n=1 Tax=Piscinibacter terrae TaxID=2496871 RepID=A0A3N7HPJ3_9BURK|nr:nickel/cobalt efflux transporter [Albitalea terrae]RQP22661.1 nickel/cobalt efflux transporter RcnA [Albitalea terrae]
MTDIATLLQQGAGNAWLFIPSAILLGALHGLEPGHSKTMMAAFIVAIRGTVTQAVLLGLSATASHTAIVWLVALVGLYYGGQWNAETTQPYFQLASAVLIIGVALWMLWRTWRQERERHGHDHHHDHGHEHAESRTIDTGHGTVRLEIFEEGMPPHFRLHQAARGHQWSPQSVTVETSRPDGSTQAFRFENLGGFLQSVDAIPEPHEFTARLKLGHGHHSHDYDVEFTEQGHDHAHHAHGAHEEAADYEDAHERAHANDIKRRFANRHVTTGQIVIFGLTGGLVPCPAAITVLLLCLQLKKITLGATLVMCFSIGLALTMVMSGTIAALTVRHAARRWSGFGELARKAPYVSSVLIILVGLYVGYHGWLGMDAAGH